jgi:hypothetical protein
MYTSITNALDLEATVRLILKNLTVYRHSIHQLHDAIKEHKPDIVVNFFELLGGLTYGLQRPSLPMFCIGHQCMALHPVFSLSHRALAGPMAV